MLILQSFCLTNYSCISHKYFFQADVTKKVQLTHKQKSSFFKEKLVAHSIYIPMYYITYLTTCQHFLNIIVSIINEDLVFTAHFENKNSHGRSNGFAHFLLLWRRIVRLFVCSLLNRFSFRLFYFLPLWFVSLAYLLKYAPKDGGLPHTMLDPDAERQEFFIKKRRGGCLISHNKKCKTTQLSRAQQRVLLRQGCG